VGTVCGSDGGLIETRAKQREWNQFSFEMVTTILPCNFGCFKAESLHVKKVRCEKRSEVPI
jgi:hypothetical protein